MITRCDFFHLYFSALAAGNISVNPANVIAHEMMTAGIPPPSLTVTRAPASLVVHLRLIHVTLQNAKQETRDQGRSSIKRSGTSTLRVLVSA